MGISAGYTFSNAYDSTIGLLTGLLNNSTSAANLATQNYNVNGLRRTGRSTAGWRYVMREYRIPGGGVGKDHFWWNGGSQFFHHD